jgi:hypothetical protein
MMEESWEYPELFIDFPFRISLVLSLEYDVRKETRRQELLPRVTFGRLHCY